MMEVKTKVIRKRGKEMSGIVYCAFPFFFYVVRAAIDKHGSAVSPGFAA